MYRKITARAIMTALLFGASLALTGITPITAQTTVTPPDSPQAVSDPFPTNQIIIKYKAGVELSGAMGPDTPAQMRALSAAAGVELAYFRPMSGDAHVLQLPSRMSIKEVLDISKKLSGLPEVEYAEPDYIMHPLRTPNDPQYTNQWHYYETYGMNLPAAWDIVTGTTSVVVAVIDTGYRPHADLSGRFVQGYDFIADALIGNDGNGRDNNAQDPGDWITAAESASGFFQGCTVSNSSWHGTHVAGTIGANSNNGVGVAGVNWAAKILPVRVLGKCGGYTSDIADGMRWAAGLAVTGVPNNANPAKVLNMSLGGGGACPATYASAISAINAAGKILAVAAGNSNANASGFNPANCAGVITVGATDRTGNRSYYSNYGAVVDVSAPGGETSPTTSNGVLSTLNSGTQGPVADNYVYYQGTSMATPHVAGLLSLMATISPTLNYTRAETILKANVRTFGPGNDCGSVGCGTGIVNAYAAVSAVRPLPPLTHKTRLPVVKKSYPLPPTVQVPNGNFESGPAGWTQHSNFGYTLILTTSALPSSVPPHGGNWAVWLGGADSEDSYIQRQVTVPAATPFLHYWYWIASQESGCSYDYAYVRVNGTAVRTHNLCTSTNTSGWVQGSVNLGAYAGQSVLLKLQVTTDGSINSNYFLDDLTFQGSLVTLAPDESTGADQADPNGTSAQPKSAP